MLNVPFVEKWIELLEGGEFEQGTGQLRKGKEYCCLGVACELYRREVGGTWLPYRKGFEEEYFIPATTEYEEYEDVDGDEVIAHEVLPAVVAEYIGISENGAIIDYQFATKRKEKYEEDLERWSSGEDIEEPHIALIQESLAELNDETDLGFKGIADTLREMIKEEQDAEGTH